ncbi:hypothetical protein [Marinobacter sp. DUT-1]|uniref:hypothetical protein n=1 Tax=Marinobacter sp. DUT-1 TaxID=3412037 RepID=UPI003D1767F9
MTVKKRIVIHIGTEKTGTTTLQKNLLDNVAQLKTQGVLYLHGDDLINSRDIAAAMLPDSQEDDYLNSLGIGTNVEGRSRFREKIYDKLKRDIEQAGDKIHTIIISSEHFHSRLRDESSVLKLKKWLEPFSDQFTVFCYLRRQVDMVTSFYSTLLKGGGIKSFDDVMDTMLREDNHYCNYQMMLEKWGNVFSESSMRVKRFDRSELLNGNIIDDFLSDIGVDKNCIEHSTDSVNESLTHFGQFILREMNLMDKARADRSGKVEGLLSRILRLLRVRATRSRLETLTLDRDRKRIRKQVIEAFRGKGQQPTADEAAMYQSRFDESNEAVRKLWFPEDPFLFSNDFKGDTCRQLSEEQESALSYAINYFQFGGQGASEFTKYDNCVEALKEASHVMEERDLVKARKVLTVAKAIRPGGPAINQRLAAIDQLIRNAK